jgi:hypothetical protein
MTGPWPIRGTDENNFWRFMYNVQKHLGEESGLSPLQAWCDVVNCWPDFPQMIVDLFKKQEVKSYEHLRALVPTVKLLKQQFEDE